MNADRLEADHIAREDAAQEAAQDAIVAQMYADENAYQTESARVDALLWDTEFGY